MAKGAERGMLLAQSGLTERDLSDQDCHVPVGRYLALIEAAAALTGREYGRGAVITSYASATATMRAPRQISSPLKPNG